MHATLQNPKTPQSGNLGTMLHTFVRHCSCRLVVHLVQ